MAKAKAQVDIDANVLQLEANREGDLVRHRALRGALHVGLIYGNSKVAVAAHVGARHIVRAPVLDHLPASMDCESGECCSVILAVTVSAVL